MYAFVRERKNGNTDKGTSISESAMGKDTYKAYKCEHSGVTLDLMVSDPISQSGYILRICWK